MLVVGDVHLGHHQTSTESIVANLNKYCTTDDALRMADFLIIEGDLFDRLLNNADENLYIINQWITRILYKCRDHKVKLRVLEGTPSHDRKQSR